MALGTMSRTYDIIINVLQGRQDAESIKKKLEGAGHGMSNAVGKMSNFARLANLDITQAAEGAAMAGASGRYMMSPGGFLHNITPLGQEAGMGTLNEITGGTEEGFRHATIGKLLSPMTDSAAASTFRKELEGAGKVTKGFRMDMLSLMFFSQNLASVFNGMASEAIGLFGIGKMLKTTILMLLIPALKPLIPAIASFFKSIMSAPEKLRQFVGDIILVAGPVFTALGFIASAILMLTTAGLMTVTGASELLIILTALAAVVTLLGSAVLFFWDSIYSILQLAAYHFTGGLTYDMLAGNEYGSNAIFGVSSDRPNVNVNANVATGIDIDILARTIFDKFQGLSSTVYGGR